MNIRDKRDIRNLYYFHRFIKSSIARLYGLSHVSIQKLLTQKKGEDVTIVSDTECLLCGLDDVNTFYIDGNRENKDPQNIIMLCEADKRRILHLQLRRRSGVIKDQF